MFAKHQYQEFQRQRDDGGSQQLTCGDSRPQKHQVGAIVEMAEPGMRLAKYRTAGAGGPGVVAILVSMAAFAVGVYLSTRIVKPSEGSGKWPQRVTVALGVSLIAHAVFLVVWFASNGQPTVDVAHVLLASWALAMGMQSAAVRTLHVDGVFTTAATATIIFLVSDITNWSATIAERRRFAGVLVSLFVGATAGGLLLVHAHIYAPLLPFVITVAAVATAAIVFRERVLVRSR